MSEPNPYAPPQADVLVSPRLVQVPAAVEKKIRNAWIAALLSAGVTLTFSVFGFAGFNLANLVDVALILAMTYGLFRKSRVAAVGMLLYFIVSKAFIIAETGKVDGLVLGLVFLYFYYQGVVGTFQYQKLLKSANQDPAVAPEK